MVISILFSSSACDIHHTSPSKICSSDDTYGELLGIISENSNGALRLLDASPNKNNKTTAKFLSVLDLQHVRKNVVLSTPLVTGVNKEIGSVSCSVHLSLKIPKTIVANLNTSSLGASDIVVKVDDAGMDLKASYDVQSAADGSRDVVSLQNAPAISALSGVATIYNELIKGNLGKADENLIDSASSIEDSQERTDATAGDTSERGCFGDWIYVPASFESDTGAAVHVDYNTGKYRIDFSDYSSAEGNYSQNGRPGETKTMLGGDATITNCVGGSAELILHEPDRTLPLRRFKGDRFEEWKKRGWKPEDD